MACLIFDSYKSAIRAYKTSFHCLLVYFACLSVSRSDSASANVSVLVAFFSSLLLSGSALFFIDSTLHIDTYSQSRCLEQRYLKVLSYYKECS